MSHQVVQLPPGLLPLTKPLKPDKKRRIRKARTGEATETWDIGDASPVDDIFVLEGEDEGAAGEDEFIDIDGARSPLTWFSGATMKALLQAQEET